MKTQTQINWYAGDQSDWTGIELIDIETGETHATMDVCTPEALALITNAPELMGVLQAIQKLTKRRRLPSDTETGWELVAVERLEQIAMKARKVIAKVETEAKK